MSCKCFETLSGLNWPDFRSFIETKIVSQSGVRYRDFTFQMLAWYPLDYWMLLNKQHFGDLPMRKALFPRQFRIFCTFDHMNLKTTITWRKRAKNNQVIPVANNVESLLNATFVIGSRWALITLTKLNLCSVSSFIFDCNFLTIS